MFHMFNLFYVFFFEETLTSETSVNIPNHIQKCLKEIIGVMSLMVLCELCILLGDKEIHAKSK